MTTIQDINSTIISGNFTNDQLDAIAMAIKFARGQLTQKNRFTMTIGSKVSFTNSRTGQKVIGTVSKVNRKFILVNDTLNGRWRVPGNMLTVEQV